MSPCIDAETLEQLLAGTVSDVEASALREHLRGCTRCQKRLDELTDDAELRAWAAEARHVGDGNTHAASPRFRQLVGDLCSSSHLWTSTDGSVGPRDLSLSFLGPARYPEDLGALGSYRIQTEVARGGMGVVLRGFDEGLKRPVAIKVIRPQFSTEATRARLLYEAQAAASLRHDHIVQIYAVAITPDGLPYLVMEYLEGPTLAERVQKGPALTPRESARIVAEVAAGLAAAHAAGLVHRDVKPGNILLDAPSGRAKILDFGLARLKEQPTGVTHEGVLGGTPAYMSPEQVQAATDPDARTDIYSLGVTLYEALTGEVPFRGKTHLVLQQILRDEPRLPRRLNDAVPPDLENICLKAMAKEPARRYATALALADDLRRWLRGEPVEARPVGRLERGWRWCRRNPVVAGLAATLLLVFAGGFAGVLLQWRRAEAALATAQQEHDRAQERFREALAAVDRYYTTVSENRLLHEPGMLELRKELLRAAADYYARFANEQREDPSVQAELGRALFRLASLTRDTGSPSKALEWMQQSLEVRRQLLEHSPDDLQLQSDVSGTLNALANLYTETSQVARALAVHEQSLALARHLVETHPESPAGFLGILRSSNNLALIYRGLGKDQEAVAAFEQAQVAARGLVEGHPEDAHYRREQVRIFANLSELHFAAGRLTRAAELHAEVVAGAKELARKFPAVIEYQALAAGSPVTLLKYQALAAQQQSSANPRLLADLEATRSSLDRLTRLAAANPSDTGLQRILIAVWMTMADLHRALGSFDEAKANYQEALALAERLASKDTNHLSVSFDTLAIRLGMVVLFADTGQLQDMLAEAERLEATAKQLPAEFKQLANIDGLSIVYGYRGLAHWEQKQYAQASADWERAAALGGKQYAALRQAGHLLAQSRADGTDCVPLYLPIYEQATQDAAQMQNEVLLGGAASYWMALVYAVSAAAAARDERYPGTERGQRAERYARQAVGFLERARGAGYFRRADRLAALKSEPVLMPLRSRIDFEAFGKPH